MSQSDEERTAPPSMLVRADEIQQQIQQLSGRDLQLWSIGILVMLVLTSGLLALILPNLVWSQLFAHIDRFLSAPTLLWTDLPGLVVQYLSVVTKADAQQHPPGFDSRAGLERTAGESVAD